MVFFWLFLFLEGGVVGPGPVCPCYVFVLPDPGVPPLAFLFTAQFPQGVCQEWGCSAPSCPVCIFKLLLWGCAFLHQDDFSATGWTFSGDNTALLSPCLSSVWLSSRPARSPWRLGVHEQEVSLREEKWTWLLSIGARNRAVGGALCCPTSGEGVGFMWLCCLC